MTRTCPSHAADEPTRACVLSKCGSHQTHHSPSTSVQAFVTRQKRVARSFTIATGYETHWASGDLNDMRDNCKTKSCPSYVKLLYMAGDLKEHFVQGDPRQKRTETIGPGCGPSPTFTFHYGGHSPRSGSGWSISSAARDDRCLMVHSNGKGCLLTTISP